jgi:hypothetical protein
MGIKSGKKAHFKPFSQKNKRNHNMLWKLGALAAS